MLALELVLLAAVFILVIAAVNPLNSEQILSYFSSLLVNFSL